MKCLSMKSSYTTPATTIAFTSLVVSNSKGTATRVLIARCMTSALTKLISGSLLFRFGRFSFFSLCFLFTLFDLLRCHRMVDVWHTLSCIPIFIIERHLLLFVSSLGLMLLVLLLHELCHQRTVRHDN